MKRLQSLLPLVFALILCCVYLAYGVRKENPVGMVEGTVVMSENGRPLPNAIVLLSPDHTNADLPERSGTTDAKGHFRISRVAAGLYSVNSSSTAHQRRPFAATVEDGGILRLDLKLKPGPPTLNLDMSRHVFSAIDIAGVHMNGFIAQSDISLSITRLSPKRIADAGGLAATYAPLNGKDRQLGPDAFGESTWNQNVPVKKDAEGMFYKRFQLPKLKEGIYWVEATAGPLHSGSYMDITHLALITKFTGRKLLAYSVDIKSGLPIPGVSIFTGNSKEWRKLAVSDSQGLAEATLSPTQKSVIVGTLGDSVAVCERQGENMKERSGPNTFFLYTDRPIYRPGDTIQFKGIVRRLTGLNYGLANPEPVTASLFDESGSKLAEIHIPASRNGAFHGSFTTSKEAAPGDFRIEAESASGNGEVDVPISEYRKPAYTITVLGDKPLYVIGDRVRATVACEYYYGGPVVGAKVQVDVFRSVDWESDNAEDDSQPDQSSDDDEEFRGGSYSEHIDAVTDAAGHAVIDFPTKGDQDPDEFSNDYVYTIEASVADVGNQSFDGSGSVRVVRGDVSLSIQPDHYVAAPGDTVQIAAKTTDEENRNQAVGGRTVSIVVGEDDWDGTKRLLKPLSKFSVVTDSQGDANVSLPINATGSLRVDATTTDRAGHTIRAENYIYVSGDASLSESSRNTITATLDRPRYNVGDTAKVLLQTGKPGGSALVTVEADSILVRKVVPIDHRATLVSIPIDLAMSPDAYVSVAYIRDETYMEANRSLTVKRVDRDLQVAVTPDRTTAKPGEFVTFNIKTTDSHGKPMAADASLSVVDEAIYAVHKDTTNIRSGFYPYRQDSVDTNYSFPEIFLDGGDKGSGKMPIRSRFLDTAAWTPDVETGKDGSASVRVKLPDNLTRWRATAVACSDNATVGMNRSDVTARKDLMVIVHCPTYLVAGDHQEVPITVDNETGADADVKLNLQTTGVAVDSAPPPTLHVANGHPETVTVNVTAGTVGEGQMTAQATLPNGSGDAVRMPVRIAPHSVPDVTSRAGETEGAAVLGFIRRPDIDPSSSRLRLTLSPSVAASLLRPMANLVDFPYGCVEQTMSRFMPSLLVTKAFKETGLPLPALSSRLPEIATDSFTRLARFQHEDGGWGWWEYDESSPFMTALVLDGLDRAKGAGYPPPASIGVSRALRWARRWLGNHSHDESPARDLTYFAYVFARYGEREPARDALRQAAKLKLTSTSVAYIALAHFVLGDGVKPWLDNLRKRAQNGRTGVYWPDDPTCEWGEESTGIALTALTTLAPDDPLIPSTVQGLLARRSGDEWISTRDTAYVLTGLSQYLAHSHEASSVEQVEIGINGHTVRTVTLDPHKELSEVTVDLPSKELPVGNFSVDIRHSGGNAAGRVYYTAELLQNVVADHFSASSSDPGFTVARHFYLMQPTRLTDGSMQLLPSAKPVVQAPTGSIVLCVVTIRKNQPSSYLQVECPTPSNCHVTEREDLAEGETWSYWWSSTVVRADRIAFFSQLFSSKEEELRYMMRAESPGVSVAMPVVAMNMYDPSDRATSDDTQLEVTR